MSTSTPTVPKHHSDLPPRSTTFSTCMEPSQTSPNTHHLDQHKNLSDTLREMEQAQHPTTPPRTPQKSSSNTATTVKNQLSGSESVSKPRSKARHRNKNPLNSPTVSRNDRSTPPLTGVHPGIPSARSNSTPSTTAYAGPTFHASPAPSTLPIPSFYAKAAPDSPDIKSLQSGKEESSSSYEESPTPPVAKLALPQPQREESPLDLFFKADREEKARARSASSFHTLRTESGPFPPPHNSPRTSHNTPPPGSQDRNRTTQLPGKPSSALLAMELESASSPGKPYGPAFSTPYQERINAARAAPPPTEPPIQEQPKATEMSEALKLFLFSPMTQGSPVSRPSEPPRTLGISGSQQIPEAALRSVSNSSIPQRGSGNLSWSPHNSFSHLNNSGASRDSPRAGSRSSGLRQEFIATQTTAPASEQAGLFDPEPASPFRSLKYDKQITSQNLAKNSSSVSSPLQVSVSPSVSPSGGQPKEFKQIEERLRRILKLEPVGNSTA